MTPGPNTPFPPPIPIASYQAMIVSRRAHALKAEGRSIVHMEYGQPSTGAPAQAIARAHTVLDTDPMGYWESAALKARIARWYGERHGVDVAPERIVLTCGASPALVLALTSGFRPGDRIAMARPGYVAYRNSVTALGMMPVEIACGADVRFQLTAEALARLDPAPAGVIVASPANPTGTIIAPDELAAIAKVCAARRIRIVSDEIYHGISYGMPTDTLLRHDPQALIINSFSKYFSMPGWRLGWLVAPEDLTGAAYARMSNLMLTPPVIAQAAGLVAMDCTAELDGHLATYGANRALLLDALPTLGLAGNHRAGIAPPDGAFYIWADVAHLLDDGGASGGFANSLALCRQLLEDTGVATSPGIDYDPVEGPHFLRFSFAVSTPDVREAIARMVPWFRERP